MANFTAVAAVNSSIVRFLTRCFADLEPVSGATTSVITTRTEDLNRDDNPLITTPCLALFLYRVDFNKSMRAHWSAQAHVRGTSILPLEFHYLMIHWGTNADEEYRIIGRTLQCLEDTPILTGPLLDPVTDWAPGDTVQVTLEDLSTEDVMRTFDSLPIDYKLCIPYVAKLVTLEGRRNETTRETAQADLQHHAEVPS